MKQIQRLTVRTPRTVQIAFLIFLAIMMTPFFIYIASASPIDHSICDEIYYDTYVWQVERKDYVQCVNRWTLLTNKAKRSYITNYK